MGTISKRYVKAVFQFASEKGEEHRLYREMKSMAAGFTSFRNLQQVLNNPTVPVQEKLKVLTTAAGIQVSDSCRSLLELLMKNKRESCARSIALMYIEHYKKAHRLIDCYLTTTQPASSEVKTALEQLIKTEAGQSVDFLNETNSDIIGGFVLRIDDLQLDASIKTQLHRLRMQLTE